MDTTAVTEENFDLWLQENFPEVNVPEPLRTNLKTFLRALGDLCGPSDAPIYEVDSGYVQLTWYEPCSRREVECIVTPQKVVVETDRGNDLQGYVFMRLPPGLAARLTRILVLGWLSEDE